MTEPAEPVVEWVALVPRPALRFRPLAGGRGRVERADGTAVDLDAAQVALLRVLYDVPDGRRPEAAAAQPVPPLVQGTGGQVRPGRRPE